MNETISNSRINKLAALEIASIYEVYKRLGVSRWSLAGIARSTADQFDRFTRPKESREFQRRPAPKPKGRQFTG